MDNLKGDIINAAYSRGRISGLTTQPTPREVAEALRRLENMAAEWEEDNICTGYFFEDTPDTGTPHNIRRSFWNAYETNLACRILADFGKAPLDGLRREAATSFSRLSARTAQVRQVRPPSRYPRGSGNRLNPWQRFSQSDDQAPISCDTNKMTVGEIDNFTESYDSYLQLSETIATYTIEADSGLSILSESLSSPIIDYQVEAVSLSSEASTSVQTVKITVTTTFGRVEIRNICFEVEADD